MINIYIAAYPKTWKRADRSMCYVLEKEYTEGPLTLTGFMECTGTWNECTARTLARAVSRLNRPDDVRVHTDNKWLLDSAKAFEDMRRNRFMKKDGTPCAGSEAFASMSPKIKTMEAGSKEHGYAAWMENELKKRRETAFL
jgi:hypothetical protein